MHYPGFSGGAARNGQHLLHLGQERMPWPGQEAIEIR